MSTWITILNFMYPQEAYLAKSLLETEGIPVYLKDEFTVQVYNFYSNAIGGVKLQVPEEYIAGAQKLLVEAGYIKPEKTEEKTETDVYDKYFKSICPYCDSTEISKVKFSGYSFLISIMVMGAPIPLRKKKYHCFDCGKEWYIK